MGSSNLSNHHFKAVRPQASVPTSLSLFSVKWVSEDQTVRCSWWPVARVTATTTKHTGEPWLQKPGPLLHTRGARAEHPVFPRKGPERRSLPWQPGDTLRLRLTQAERPEPAGTGLPVGLAQPETREPGGHTQHPAPPPVLSLSSRCPQNTDSETCAARSLRLPGATFPDSQLPLDPSACLSLHTSGTEAPFHEGGTGPRAHCRMVELGLNSAPGDLLPPRR